MDLSLKYAIDTEKVSWRVIGDELLVLNLDNGNYYDLNEVAGQVWNGIIEKKSLGEIFETLKKEYRVDEKRLESDLKKIVAELQKEKLITPR